jgi:transcriptional regulator of acetoin/glycerol metabolism
MRDMLVLDDVPLPAWEAFQAGRAEALPDELSRCWSRARALGASPFDAQPEDHLLRGDALRLRSEPVALLHRLGDSIVHAAAARVSARDYVLLLANAEGVVIETVGGGAFAETARRVRLIEGACWNERSRGTNAIGTAAERNVPVAVHGRAHFAREYHGLVCYAAPVRGLDGRPVAVLDATSFRDRGDETVAAEVLRTARALEDLLRLQAYASAGASVARVLGRALDGMTDPALLVEAPGVIVRANAGARSALGADLANQAVNASLGVAWTALVQEALAPSRAGVRVELKRGAARAWRVRTEPLTTPDGAVVAVLARLESDETSRGRLTRGAAHTNDPFASIFAEDEAVRASIRWARQLAASHLAVMLLAETGAGKELFAQAIHAASGRAAGPFVAINCGAMTPTLLESELFGYAPGAFTGAERAGRPGLFHAAAGGTLFLDEVAEMPASMQATLLRVLETGTWRRVGDVRSERADVRIVCATCRDLPALVTQGAFRQDLYYRLKGATVRIPALRERADVVPLAHHLLTGKSATFTLTSAAEEALRRHDWPGNVRELKSTLEVAAVMSQGAPIDTAHLPPELNAAPRARPGSPESLADQELAAVLRALAECGGNVSHAAKRLGVARSTIYRLLRRGEG